VNESQTFCFRQLYPNEWFAFTHWRHEEPAFESILRFNRKLCGASHLVLVSFADESQLPSFLTYLRSFPLVTDVVAISEEEFLAAASDYGRYLKRYRNA
jgi:hypothetical protein